MAGSTLLTQIGKTNVDLYCLYSIWLKQQLHLHTNIGMMKSVFLNVFVIVTYLGFCVKQLHVHLSSLTVSVDSYMNGNTPQHPWCFRLSYWVLFPSITAFMLYIIASVLSSLTPKGI